MTKSEAGWEGAAGEMIRREGDFITQSDAASNPACYILKSEYGSAVMTATEAMDTSPWVAVWMISGRRDGLKVGETTAVFSAVRLYNIEKRQWEPKDAWRTMYEQYYGRNGKVLAGEQLVARDEKIHEKMMSHIEEIGRKAEADGAVAELVALACVKAEGVNGRAYPWGGEDQLRVFFEGLIKESPKVRAGLLMHENRQVREKAMTWISGSYGGAKADERTEGEEYCTEGMPVVATPVGINGQCGDCLDLVMDIGEHLDGSGQCKKIKPTPKPRGLMG